MISYYFKETLRIFKRSPFASIVTISITTLAILLCSMSLFVILMSKDFSDRVKKNIEVYLYLSENLTGNEILGIKNKLESNKYISNVVYLDKEKATKEFIKETGESFESVLDANPLPNSFLIKFDPKSINESNFAKYVEDLKNIKGITEAVYDYNVVVRILKIFKSIEIGVYISAILLLILSIYLVYINNRLQYEHNKNLYQTMKLVGAKLSSLKIPYLFNGILVGLISSFICIGINLVVLNLLTTININLKLFNNFNGLHLIPILIGIVLGLIGSYFSSLKMSLKIDEASKLD